MFQFVSTSTSICPSTDPVTMHTINDMTTGVTWCSTKHPKCGTHREKQFGSTPNTEQNRLSYVTVITVPTELSGSTRIRNHLSTSFTSGYSPHRTMVDLIYLVGRPGTGLKGLGLLLFVILPPTKIPRFKIPSSNMLLSIGFIYPNPYSILYSLIYFNQFRLTFFKETKDKY